MGPTLSKELGQFGGNLATGTLSGFAGGMTVSALRGGRASATQVALDAFGNALVNSIVGEMSSIEQQTAELDKGRAFANSFARTGA